MPHIAVVYHSSTGNTAAQAAAVVRGVKSSDAASVSLLTTQEARGDLAILNRADAIVFGTPTFFGGVSADMKAFLDATIDLWFQGAWKDKLAAGFTTSSTPSGDKVAALSQLVIFAAQHGMVWVPLGIAPGRSEMAGGPPLNLLGGHLGAMAQTWHPDQPEAGLTESDVSTAEFLGKQVVRWCARAASQ